jgi:hypothetical protein
MVLKAGTLGYGTLAAGTGKLAYACVAPAVWASVTVSFCNKNDIPVKVRYAIGPGADIGAQGTIFMEHDPVLEAHQPLDRSGIAVAAGLNLFLLSNENNVDYYISGFEK